MSPEHEPGHDDRGPLLTAYALGAATPEECRHVEMLLASAESGESRAHVAEMRAMAAALEAARDREELERSPTLRRAVLAAAVRHDAAAAIEPRRRRRVGGIGEWGWWVGSHLVTGTLAAGLVFAVMRPTRETNRSRQDVATVTTDASRDHGAENPTAVVEERSGNTGQVKAEQRVVESSKRATNSLTAMKTMGLDLSNLAEETWPSIGEEGLTLSAALSGRQSNADTGVVPWFGGINTGLDMMLADNRDFSLQYNHDSSFDSSGFATRTYRMGGSRRRKVHDQMEQPMMRNEHIVRAHQVPSVALNSNHGNQPWRAMHVNNSPTPPATTVNVTGSAGLINNSPTPPATTVNMTGSAGLKFSITGSPDPQQGNSERYSRFADNRFLSVADQPLSTFSIDVDTASYANVRRFLTAGQQPPADAVRIEELVNYFRYDYPRPKGDEPFSVTLEAAACPWREGHRIVRVGLAGREVRHEARPAGNLVFLVDVSGSMNEPSKLPLVKQSLSMLVDELSENDRVAIVVYAGNAGLVLPSTSGDQKDKIRAAIQALEAGGSTHGSAGINLAYDQAAERFIQGGANRVILCTDGDLNVGVTSDAALVELIGQKARGGTFLTVLGFGTGNLQDAKMEQLADNGNGVYAYIDGVREARKVLVEQLTGSMIAIAKDVKIQVEFNPAQVASYRLLGYENRALAAEDFRDDKKDAGEIGAGHTVTALYEVVMVDREAAGGRGAEPLKYQPARAPAIEGPANGELLTVKLRWKKPEADESTLVEVPLADRGGAFDAASADLRFATAVAGFGMILRRSEHVGTATLPLVAEIAGGALGADPGGYRAEFLDLVRRAGAGAGAGQ